MEAGFLTLTYNTDRHNSSVMCMLPTIGVTTGRNTGVKTDKPVYT